MSTAPPTDAPRSLTDVLAETSTDLGLELAGLDVVDVGCGDGALVRWFRAQGADPIGIECGVELRRRAIAADPDHADAYLDGVGEDLPLDDAGADLVVFAASLHHVPTAWIPTALAEARRILRPDGTLWVFEPAAEGPEDAVAAPVVDETDERRAAQDAIDGAHTSGLEVVRRFEYVTESSYDDVEAWLASMVDIDHERAIAVEQHREHLVERFHRIGEARDGRWYFRRRSLAAVLAPTADGARRA